MVEAGPLVRARLDVSYDGTDFSGWAAQPGRRTVQGVLEQALATVLRLPAVPLTVAGRTDAGVHATGQVAHCDIPRPDDRLLRRLRGVLPADLRVRAVTEVGADFDARFAASWRRYVYLIGDAPGGVDPLRRAQVLFWPRPLDADLMRSAAARMPGLRDFAAFCKRREGATTIRTLLDFDVRRDAERPGEIRCELTADAFCHSMVRSLIGALLAVGERRRDVDWPAALLERTARADDVAVAPPHGLTLVEVGYPPPQDWAARIATSRTRREG